MNNDHALAIENVIYIVTIFARKLQRNWLINKKFVKELKNMIKSIKVQLQPHNKQNSLLFQCAGVARWAYNWTLNRQQKNYEDGGQFISNNDLRKELTQLKKTDELQWLNNYSNNITKQAIKDACHAYKKFFAISDKHYSPKTMSKSKKLNQILTYRDLEGYPNFKSKKHSKPAFYHDNVKIKFTHTHVFIEKLGKIKLAEHGRIPVNAKYLNPRITFDSLNWNLSVAIEVGDMTIHHPRSEAVGMDIGTKDVTVINTDRLYKNINNTKSVKKADQRFRRLQRQLNRQFENHTTNHEYPKSQNLLKLEYKKNKASQRLKNLRMNYIHQITTALVINKPAQIVIEDFNRKALIKNKHVSNSMSEHKLYEFKRQLEYKCLWYGVPLRFATNGNPSSKTCSYCDHIKKFLKISDRVHICDCCNVIKEDLNVGIDLTEYQPLANVI